MIYALLTLATLITSVVSGVLSMAGGMILMGVFGFLLSVPAAMVLHGIAQAFSNGSRVWFHRRHVRWNLLLPYSLGALIVLGVFSSIAFVPSIGLVFIIIGSFPVLALRLPRSVNLDMSRKPVAFLSGLIVTSAQMLAGASGPVLDIFYVKSSLTRREILGSKAVTQTLGHILKLVYYSFLMARVSQELPAWLFPAIIIAALGGNWIGKELIEKISDDQFKTAGRYIILVVGVIYIAKGIYELSR